MQTLRKSDLLNMFLFCVFSTTLLIQLATALDASSSMFDH